MMKSNANQALVFAVCLDNDGYTASLEVGKLYRVISDEEAAAHGYIRVVDESGEDYAFTANRFHLVHLPQTVAQALLATSRT
jgi:hypothetical protein